MNEKVDDLLKRKPMDESVRKGLKENHQTKESMKTKTEQRLEEGRALEKNMFYDPAVLRKMKSAGMPRPANCHPADWYASSRLTPKWYLVARMMAVGMNSEEIAGQTGLHPRTIQKISKTSRFQFELEKVRKELINAKDFTKRVNEIVPEAIETAFNIMMNDESKDSIRLSAAQDFMDRGMGKPLQRIENNGSKIAELFDRLDEIKAIGGMNVVKKMTSEEQIIDGEVMEIQTEEHTEPKDDLDEWIEKNVKAAKTKA